jgi:outer membrane protein OmpA-like peptidoglycan-associated protein
MRGRLAHLRREVQMAFGASLLGVATVSCVAGPRSTVAVAPKPAPTAHRPVEGVANPGEVSAGSASSGSDEATRPGAVAAIYGSSAIAIDAEVEYARNSLAIDAEGERTLVALKELLETFDCDVAIEGHAGRDEAKAAEWLSKRRAELVRDRLLALGADAERLSVEAAGASRPKATSQHAPERDRRVSFSFHAKVNGTRRDCDESDRRDR